MGTWRLMYKDLLSSLPIKPNSYKKGHVEKMFQYDIFSSLRKLSWICFHVPDVGLWTKFLDWVLISPTGDTVFLEFKKTDGYTFNLSQFESSQIALLTKLETRPNAEVYIPIYSRKTMTYVLHTFAELKAMRNEAGGCKVFSK